jgi:hypothetical protein
MLYTALVSRLARGAAHAVNPCAVLRMNPREIAETEAARLLADYGVPQTADALSIATIAILRGWARGLRDAGQIRRESFESVLPPVKPSPPLTVKRSDELLRAAIRDYVSKGNAPLAGSG